MPKGTRIAAATRFSGIAHHSREHAPKSFAANIKSILCLKRVTAMTLQWGKRRKGGTFLSGPIGRELKRSLWIKRMEKLSNMQLQSISILPFPLPFFPSARKSLDGEHSRCQVTTFFSGLDCCLKRTDLWYAARP